METQPMTPAVWTSTMWWRLHAPLVERNWPLPQLEPEKQLTGFICFWKNLLAAKGFAEQHLRYASRSEWMFKETTINDQLQATGYSLTRTLTLLLPLTALRRILLARAVVRLGQRLDQTHAVRLKQLQTRHASFPDAALHHWLQHLHLLLCGH